MQDKLKLSSYTLKRYEPKLDRYIFFNVKTGEFWDTDYITGSVAASLDGSMSAKEVVDVLISNSDGVAEKSVEKHFYEVFDFLLEGGFVCYEN